MLMTKTVTKRSHARTFLLAPSLSWETPSVADAHHLEGVQACLLPVSPSSAMLAKT